MHFFNHKIIRHIIAVGIVIITTATVSISAFADINETKKKIEDAKKERAETQEELEETKENISELNEAKSSLQSELNNLNNQLTEVSNNLADIEAEIENKENEIEITKANLEDARLTEQEQYEAMKKRVQFIYEEQSFVLLEMIFQIESFGDFLNHSSYIAAMSSYDRQQLQEYEETRQYIEEQEASLEEELAELDSLRADREEEQSRVSGLVSTTSSNISQYSSSISAAEEEAEAQEAEIAKQNEDIKALEAQLAEEIRLSKLAANSSWRNISDVTFADGDRELLANLIYCEAGSESYEGKLAVGAVVINRVLSSVYPSTVVGVIYQNKQFSPASSGKLALALANNSATADCYTAADQAMSGVTNVGNCVYFRTPVSGLTGITIGGHIFY
ncbi:MAG: cell wall hydrolase [Butyrivibrio sp.]|nr:cell wall hydrolase [Butyrivibrio sp.]